MPTGENDLVLLRLPSGVARLRRGVLDAEALRAFTQGQCHALSLALNDLTGWPIELVVEKPRRHTNRVAWVHAVNRQPDGMLVDIEGAHSEPELLAGWGGARVTLLQTDPGTVLKLHRKNGGVEPDVESAATFAETLLSHLVV